MQADTKLIQAFERLITGANVHVANSIIGTYQAQFLFQRPHRAEAYKRLLELAIQKGCCPKYFSIQAKAVIWPDGAATKII